jgi:RNA polymerase sigma-70 factor (ECF subfamily)
MEQYGEDVWNYAYFLTRKHDIADDISQDVFFKAYLQKRYSDDLWEIVMQLPIKYRETLLLNAHYQLSLEEISQALNISIGTVKSRLHRARSRLAELIGRESKDVTI